MYLLKLGLFTLSATFAGSTTVGMLNVQIHEYEVPTPKSRPHDPALAPDGSLWYTGMRSKIVIADDSPVIRHFLRLYIQMDHGLANLWRGRKRRSSRRTGRTVPS